MSDSPFDDTEYEFAPDALPKVPDEIPRADASLDMRKCVVMAGVLIFDQNKNLVGVRAAELREFILVQAFFDHQDGKLTGTMNAEECQKRLTRFMETIDLSVVSCRDKKIPYGEKRPPQEYFADQPLADPEDLKP